MHGLLDRIMMMLNVPAGGPEGYEVEAPAEEGGPYFPGRLGRITFKGEDIGRLGVVHPDVLANFDIVNPVSVVEICIEGLLTPPPQ